MAFTTSLWAVNGNHLQAQDRVRLDSEKRLEDWIAADLKLLGEDLLLIGRQIRTTGGPLDILAIDGEGQLVIAELKRDKTPREVVAQVLDYASWVSQQSPRDIADLYQSTKKGSLPGDFRSHFGYDLPEAACKSHRMLIVAAQLDDSSERIVRYLQETHQLDINAVFFSVYRVGSQEVLVRAWLADPETTQERAERRDSAPWSGLWFVNIGMDDVNKRDWELCRKHGCLSAGGSDWYWKPLYKLAVGDRIAAYQSGSGYLGVGEVTTAAVPADEYRLPDGRCFSDVTGMRGTRDEPIAEHVIGVRWLKTFPLSEGKTFKGAFANQNIVCKLRHSDTLEFLRREFGL